MNFSRQLGSVQKKLAILAVLTAFTLPIVSAQDRDREERLSTIDVGTIIPVRANETIDVERRDNRVYTGTVDQDVRGTNGRLAIPRGSQVELIVRVERDNDLIIDLESLTANGQRYGIRTDATRAESVRDNSLVGTIVGAIQGGEAQGRAVRIPRDSLMTFRVARSLDINVPDRGVDREGRHYHDWYDNDNR